MFQKPDLFIQYTHDDIFQDDFWNKLSISITSQTPAYEKGKINVDKFLNVPMNNLRNYTVKELTKIAKDKKCLLLEDKSTINNKTTKKEFNVSLEKARYLWLSTRIGKVFGDAAPGLDVIPRFSLTQKEK